MAKTAIILGSTGLVGSNILDVVLNDSEYSSVVSFGRRKLSVNNSKLIHHIVDFDKCHFLHHKSLRWSRLRVLIKPLDIV